MPFLLFRIPDLNVVIGSIQIGNCTPPPPTSKDQCMNGGWRNYPQFKNQGQCVAFVNHRPDPRHFARHAQSEILRGRWRSGRTGWSNPRPAGSFTRFGRRPPQGRYRYAPCSSRVLRRRPSLWASSSRRRHPLRSLGLSQRSELSKPPQLLNVLRIEVTCDPGWGFVASFGHCYPGTRQAAGIRCKHSAASGGRQPAADRPPQTVGFMIGTFVSGQRKLGKATLERER